MTISVTHEALDRSRVLYELNLESSLKLRPISHRILNALVFHHYLVFDNHLLSILNKIIVMGMRIGRLYVDYV